MSDEFAAPGAEPIFEREALCFGPAARARHRDAQGVVEVVGAFGHARAAAAAPATH